MFAEKPFEFSKSDSEYILKLVNKTIEPLSELKAKISKLDFKKGYVYLYKSNKPLNSGQQIDESQGVEPIKDDVQTTEQHKGKPKKKEPVKLNNWIRIAVYDKECLDCTIMVYKDTKKWFSFAKGALLDCLEQIDKISDYV